MNVVPLDPPVTDSLRRQLARLPVFEPAAELAARIVHAPAPTVGMQRRRGLVMALSGAVLAVLLLVGLPLQRTEIARPSTANRMAALETEFAALRAAAAGDTPGAAAGLELDLLRLDRELQSAYDDHADRARLERLWRDRESLLDGLVLAYREPDRLVRI